MSHEALWFYEARLEAKKLPSSGMGRSEVDPGQCFYLTHKYFPEYIELFKNPRKRPYYFSMLRTFGYKAAIEKWAYENEINELLSVGGKTISSRLKEITGWEFKSSKDLLVWYEKNRENLFWSDNNGRLVIDRFRRYFQKPYFESASTYSEISTEQYWFLNLLGFFKCERKIAKMLYGEAYAFGPSHPGYYLAKISVRNLKDVKAKEQGYKRYLSFIAKRFKEEMERPEKMGHTSSYHFEIWKRKLEAITQKKFNSIADWISWYEEKKNKLVLSDDGERLVVKRND